MEITGQRYTGKAALLTGGGSGIGRATALRLAAEGAKLLVVDRDEAGLAETVKLIAEQLGDGAPEVVAQTTDVTDEDAAGAAVAAAVHRFGRLDLLVNNAGAHGVVPLPELTVAEFQRMMNVNMLGQMLFCRAAMPHLVATKGVVVNLASTSATHAHPFMTAYAASKGAVLAFSLSLAAEYANSGVRVVAVSPGGVDTPLVQSVRFAEGTDASFYARIMPQLGFGAADQIAATIAFAGSADAAYITGVELRVDGGSHN